MAFLERLLKKFRANGTIISKHISISLGILAICYSKSSLQKSMLLISIKKQGRGLRCKIAVRHIPILLQEQEV